MSRRVAAVLAVAAGLATPPASAGAAGPPPSVLPIAVRIPGAADDDARAAFDAAVHRAGFAATSSVELAGPAAPRAPDLLREAIGLTGDLRFADALAKLEAAAAEAAATGAAGLGDTDLSDLYLFRAIVVPKIDAAAGPRAWEDFVRAATVKPERTLDPGRFPPAVQDSWRRATRKVAEGGRGTLIVRAPADAWISLDGRPAVRSPALLPGVPFGLHLLRVDEPGRVAWAQVVPLATPKLDIDTPARAALTLDDAAAAATARAAGKAFALVAQRRAGDAEPTLDLRLVEAGSARRRDEALVPIAAGPGRLDAELGRLLAAAADRPASLAGAALPPATAQAAVASTGGWRRHAGWLIAAGAVAAAAGGFLVAGALSSNGRSDTGFSASSDPRTIGK